MEKLCTHPLMWGKKDKSQFFFSTINIFLSITAFLGNSLILVVNKETSFRPPFKLLYRCLATTNLLVGLVSQPLVATYGMFLVCKQWGLCRYARDAVYVSSFALYSVSLLTLTAIRWTYFSLC